MSTHDKIKLLCNYCNKTFYRYPSDITSKKVFCSSNCMYSSKRINKICETCNNEFTVPKHKQKQKFCSVKCRGKAFTGKNNNSNRIDVRPKLLGKNSNNWKGGKNVIKYDIRRRARYYNWRLNVFKRDNFTCQICNERGCYIEAHHIYPFAKIIDDNNIKNLEDSEKCEELWYISNGITLCKECHNKIHRGNINGNTR